MPTYNQIGKLQIHKTRLTKTMILALTNPADKIVLPMAAAGYINIVSGITEKYIYDTTPFTNAGQAGVNYYNSDDIPGRWLFSDDPTYDSQSILLASMNQSMQASIIPFINSAGMTTEVAITGDLLIGVESPFLLGGTNAFLDIYVAFRKIKVS